MSAPKRIIAECVYKGKATTEFILAWVLPFLIPARKPGQGILWDNASLHKSTKSEALIVAAGCSVLFLPPYSPDFNPIEHFWAHLKRRIRGISADFKTLEETVEGCFKNPNIQ